jgi:hypothetical protein
VRCERCQTVRPSTPQGHAPAPGFRIHRITRRCRRLVRTITTWCDEILAYFNAGLIVRASAVSEEVPTLRFWDELENPPAIPLANISCTGPDVVGTNTFPVNPRIFL